MESITAEEIQRLLDDELFPEPVVVHEYTTEPVQAVNWDDYAEPAWSEHPDFPGVQTRLVDADWLFKKQLNMGEIRQYKGFESCCPIPVPPVDPLYEPDHNNLKALCRASRLGLKPLLVGDTGSGKTSILEYFAAMTGRPFHRQEFDASTDDQKLLGSLEYDSKKGGTYFNKSDFVKSMSFPSLTDADEVCRAMTATQMLLNPILDRNQARVTSHDDDKSETIQAHPEWMFAATDNTAGNGDDLDIYSAANVMDAAVANRFDMVLNHPYPSAEVEQRIIENMVGEAMPPKVIGQLVKFSQLMHKAFSTRDITCSFSMRNIKAVVALYLDGATIHEALEANFLRRCTESERSDVQETIRTVFF